MGGLQRLLLPTVALLLLFLLSHQIEAAKFPPDNFALGCATSAYQIEGATTVDGRGETIWDTFVASGAIEDGSNAEKVAQSYYRYAEDAKQLAAVGATTYSLTISWARIIPNGDGPVEQRGIDYYRRVVREMKANGLEVYATLYHWELPSALQENGGWLNRTAIIDPFTKYARTVFTALAGEGVSKWITMNEPRTFCMGGYSWGDSPPGRCSDRSLCAEGDSATEPYICGHNALLAHAAAVKVWRQEFAESHQNVEIGIVLDGEWVEPLTASAADAEAARRQRVFDIGWLANPIWLGDYPPEMKSSMGDTLPTFTAAEIADIKGSSDFFAWDYYTASYAYDTLKGATCDRTNKWWPSCSGSTLNKNGVLIGPATGHPFFFSYPPGLRKGLKYLSDTYSPPSLIVTENGHAVVNESSLPPNQRLKDTTRILSLLAHIQAVREAVELDNVNVVGYFSWSLMDNFEWKLGNSVKFGLIYIDLENNSTRLWKDSAYSFCEMSRNITGHDLPCQPPNLPSATASKTATVSSVVKTSTLLVKPTTSLSRTTFVASATTVSASTLPPSVSTSSKPSSGSRIAVSSLLLLIIAMLYLA